ncbi:MAG: molybdenum cofactor guanylyltransferase [Thermoleophilaceae bacterium]|jgi:molybdopterin-guanine dinucleotide biosynthesis protein A|nr:molybdenum cofactor guanylyltransferase [Thermoleophilaceae bacterium]
MIGILLAGGAGRRLGGRSKAAIEVGGRPLAAYPAAALAGVCDRVAFVAKPGSELPRLPGVERWDEPPEPRHPLVGIVHALEHAGEAVLVCAADMPYVTPDACATLLGGAGGGGAAAAVAIADGVLQPLFAVYAPAALEPLRGAGAEGRLTGAVEALGPARVALPPRVVRSVNTPEELAEAEAELGAGWGDASGAQE